VDFSKKSDYTFTQKGDKSDVKNYRGISLVSCMSKLFTAVLNKTIAAFRDLNTTISDAPFGFRKGKSTVYALFCLFSLFIEDLELFLQNDVTSGLSFDDILLILLLFVDDMVILGKYVDEINTSLEVLCNYGNTWSLNVNAQTIKVMFFRKRGDLLNNEVFTYNGNRLDEVNDFNYL